MLEIIRYKTGKCWQVKLRGKLVHAFPTRSEARSFKAQMERKYGEMI